MLHVQVNVYNFLLFLCNPPHLQVYRLIRQGFFPWYKGLEILISKEALNDIFRLTTPDWHLFERGHWRAFMVQCRCSVCSHGV